MHACMLGRGSVLQPHARGTKYLLLPRSRMLVQDTLRGRGSARCAVPCRLHPSIHLPLDPSAPTPQACHTLHPPHRLGAMALPKRSLRQPAIECGRGRVLIAQASDEGERSAAIACRGRAALIATNERSG